MKLLSRLFFRLIIAVILFMAAACSRVPQLPPLPADAAILAFGDSLTAGTGASDGESYPAVLAGLTGRRVINAGIPGEVSASGLQRLPELLEQERPGLLILCHGGNDLLRQQDLEQLAGNLRAMLQLAGEKGVPVLLVAVPSFNLTLKPPALYEELAREFALPIENKVLPRILAKSSLKSDHIHPNAAGYRQLAEALHKLLKKSGALTS